MNRKKRILQILNIWRLIPAWILVITQPKDRKDIIMEDLEHWNKCAQTNCKGSFNAFSVLMIALKEYRSLLCARLSGETVRKLCVQNSQSQINEYFKTKSGELRPQNCQTNCENDDTVPSAHEFSDGLGGGMEILT